MIFNGVGLLITDSEILLAKLTEKENKFRVGEFFSKTFESPFNQVMGEIILLSILDDFFDEIDCKPDSMRVALSQRFFKIFSFPYEPALTSLEIKEQAKWEYSLLFPETNLEKIAFTYFISGEENARQINVVAIEKKFLETVLKFAARRNIAVNFFEHPAVAAFNAFNVADVVFDVLLYAEGGTLTYVLNSDKKIRAMESVPLNSESVEAKSERFLKLTGKENPDVLLAGAEDELKNMTANLNASYAEYDLRPFFDEKLSSSVSDSAYLSALIGILFRLK